MIEGMYDNESLDREKFYFQIEGEESKNWRGGEGKLVHAQDYRTFCREIGPGEGLLRQSDYGGRRVSMGKKKEEEGKEEEEKRGKRESGEKNQRYQTTNGVESTWEEGEGIAVGSRFSGVN